jgi:hypothetical protein
MVFLILILRYGMILSKQNLKQYWLCNSSWDVIYNYKMYIVLWNVHDQCNIKFSSCLGHCVVLELPPKFNNYTLVSKRSF